MKTKSKAIFKNIMMFVFIISISFPLHGQVSDNGDNGGQESQKINVTIPIGGIIMWSGTVPPSSNWVLCAGGIVTDPESTIIGRPIPDLRGRFVVGYDPGSPTTPTEITNTTQNYGAIHNKGGQLKVNLTAAQLPPHHHEANAGKATISVVESGKHQHTVKGQTGGDNNDHSNKAFLGAGDKGANEMGFVFNHASSNDDTHSHPNSFFSGVVGNGTTQGLVSESHENRPPYYVLAFIMRVK